MAEYLDKTGLTRLWMKIKDYIANNAVVPSDITGNAATATKLKTARAIDGVTFDGSTARSHYGVCSTGGVTAAKTVSITGFTLVTGARVMVRFNYYNSATNPTLNVSGTGAKAIYYKNVAIPAAYIKGNSLLELVYDGTYWRVVGELTQSQVDSLETRVSSLEAQDLRKSPVVLYSGSKYNTTLKTWEYASVPNLNTYTEIEFWVTIGDVLRIPVRVNKNNATQLNFNGYFSPNYNATFFVLVDWANNRIGVYTNSLIGWPYSVVNISKVYGILK